MPRRWFPRARGDMLTIVETTQSRSAKILIPGVLLSLVAASFRSLFSGLSLVGA